MRQSRAIYEHDSCCSISICKCCFALLFHTQAKSDKQHLLQQTAQSVAELKPLPSAVAELMQPIAQYVKPREFDYRTSYEYGRYDQQYQKLGDYQPQCNLVEDMACALHGELKSIYGEASSFMEKLGDLNEKLLRFQLRYGQ